MDSFPGAFSGHFLALENPLVSLARVFPWAQPLGLCLCAFSQEHFPCAHSHGRLLWILSLGGFHFAFSQEIFLCIFFRAFSVDFFARETSLGTFAWAVLVRSVVEPFYFAFVCSGVFHELSRRCFVLAVFYRSILRNIFRRASPACFSVGLLPWPFSWRHLP